MFGFNEELKEVVDAFVLLKHPFSIQEITDVIEELIERRGAYKDPITIGKVKKSLMSMLEKGDMPGYCLLARPVVDDDGPRCILEFAPHNTMSISQVEMLDLPDDFERVTCRIHPYYKQILRALSKTTNASQDMIARSILTRGLSLVFDQLK